MNDDKTARDYNIEGGSVLHLVCFLSGGKCNSVGRTLALLNEESLQEPCHGLGNKHTHNCTVTKGHLVRHERGTIGLIFFSARRFWLCGEGPDGASFELDCRLAMCATQEPSHPWAA